MKQKKMMKYFKSQHSSKGNNKMSEKEIALAGPMATTRVVINDEVYQKINHWIQKSPGEVSGLGKVTTEPDGTFRVIEAILVEQDNGAASTELDPTAVAKAMYELRNHPGHLNFWWHSHVNMAVFWSGTDIDTIREIGRNGWVLSTVFNKKRERLSAIYVKATDVLPEIFINELPTTISRHLEASLVESWNKDYEAKCKEKKWGGHHRYEYNDTYYQDKWEREWVQTEHGSWRKKTAKEFAEDELKNKTATTRPVNQPLLLDVNASRMTSEASVDLFIGSLDKDMQDLELIINYKEALRGLGDVVKIIEDESTLSKEEKETVKGEIINRFNKDRVIYSDRMDN